MAASREAATDSALKQEVEKLRCTNAVLQTENEMFESFIGQLDSLSLTSLLGSRMENEVVHRGKSESCGTSQEPPNLLKLEQKYYIAVSELEESRKELEPFNTSLARNVKYYKAAVEDLDKRLVEIKRERHEFEEFVAKTQQTTPVQAQRAQKVIGYIERKIKAKEVLTERMRRRNEFLRKQSWKQQRMVQQKEQMQDKLRRIDLEHLKQKNIHSRELLQKLQERVLCHRMLVRKSQQGLNVYKERLKKELEESETLSRKITLHEEKLSKIREQQQKVEKEQSQAKALNKKLKAQLANFRVPDVMKHVEDKAINDRLRHNIKALERKARIVKMTSMAKKHSPGDSSGCSKSEDH
ncbi:coiled-coil domain-containing protein 113 isoform X2 [Hemibagrus wyckioides]|uniref:coiled-coil domain-containing protein 113 isoform X2 n=1 Tax=Hemibagrus wyckioides TaxID=337641 RepID=UPI00266DB0B2|nr:coiled-coil domain-containing protein 113 isoform X2 [Hemibagrus wyckioides]